ncbi:DNA-binding transcriptional LysR family regulator [Pseudomonas psychrotolerans]|nr:DNA-binding transcriptional LysR family regulator [Pseudomonas psychrotolerans]
MLPTEGLPEPKLLMLFEVLYSTGSVTRAAEQLGQSQPTISLWLGKLRQQLRDPLFVRTPGGMKPTPQAEALITPCREVLESLRRLVAWEVAFDPATAQRLFRLCLSDASHITLLPRILAHLREVAPGVRLEIARIDGNTEQALEIGEADLAVGFIPWLGGGIYQQVLFPQDWVCLVSAEHPRLQDGLTAAAYAKEGHVLVSAGTGQKLLEAGLVRAEVQRRIVLELTRLPRRWRGGRQLRPHRHPATPHRQHPGRYLWAAASRVSGAHRGLRGQAALACPLSPGRRQPLVAWCLRRAVRA